MAGLSYEQFCLFHLFFSLFFFLLVVSILYSNMGSVLGGVAFLFFFFSYSWTRGLFPMSSHCIIKQSICLFFSRAHVY